jgi:hypothetical protein
MKEENPRILREVGKKPSFLQAHPTALNDDICSL